MGTIVINQTDCKQNIILESSLDGITGGYYDAEGVWHELGGDAPFVPEGYIYGGKSFKVKTDRETVAANAEIPLLATFEGGPSSIQGKYIAYAHLVANNKNTSVRFIDNTGATSDMSATNNSGAYNTGFSDFVITLPIGIVEEFKSLFDTAFEEVTE